MNTLFVLPFKELEKEIQKLNHDKDDQISFLYAEDYQNNIDKISNLINKSSADIIISRGGLYTKLKEKVIKTIIQIHISVFDILELLNLKHPKKTLFIGFENIIQPVLEIEKRLDLPVKTITIKKDSDIKEYLKKIKKYHLIYTDYHTYITLKKYNLPVKLITSSLESFKLVYKQAKEIYKEIKQKSIENQLLSSYLTEENKNVLIYLNTVFYQEKIVNTRYKEEIDDFIKHHLHALLSKRNIEYFIFKDDVKITIKNRTIKQNTNTFNIIYINFSKENNNISKFYFLNSYLDNNTYLDNIYLNKIHEMAKSALPIFFISNNSSLINKLSYNIFSNSEFNESSLICIDFSLVLPAEFNFLIKDFKSPLNTLNHNIFLYNLESLNQYQLILLLNYLKNSLILTSNKVIIYIKSQNKIITDFYNSISALNYKIANFYEENYYLKRIKEILALNNIQFNEQDFNKLSSFPFNSELDFNNFINNYLISKDLTNSLNNLEENYNFSTNLLNENLPLKLHDYYYVLKVLNENKNNHQKAAKELKIGRTTLYRILKKD